MIRCVLFGERRCLGTGRRPVSTFRDPRAQVARCRMTLPRLCVRPFFRSLLSLHLFSAGSPFVGVGTLGCRSYARLALWVSHIWLHAPQWLRGDVSLWASTVYRGDQSIYCRLCLRSLVLYLGPVLVRVAGHDCGLPVPVPQVSTLSVSAGVYVCAYACVWV